MFKRILVPLDLSGRHERTIDTACDLAQLHHAQVTLLHVVQQIPDVAAAELRGFYRRMERGFGAQARTHRGWIHGEGSARRRDGLHRGAGP
jgi:nucleotide-binding universal stress UspA family protein